MREKLLVSPWQGEGEPREPGRTSPAHRDGHFHLPPAFTLAQSCQSSLEKSQQPHPTPPPVPFRKSLHRLPKSKLQCPSGPESPFSPPWSHQAGDEKKMQVPLWTLLLPSLPTLSFSPLGGRRQLQIQKGVGKDVPEDSEQHEDGVHGHENPPQ